VNESSIISRSTFKTDILKIHNYFPHFGTSKNGFCRTIQLTFVVMSAKFTFFQIEDAPYVEPRDLSGTIKDTPKALLRYLC